MRVMTNEQVEAHIENIVKGNTFVSVLTVTEPKMVKKHRETKEPNPYLGTIKQQKKNGAIGFDYKNSVNNQAEREGKEERDTHSRKWGVLSDSRLFVHHKGNSYLQLKLQSSTDTVYTLNGKEIAENDIKPYLSSSKPSSTQADLDKIVIVNDIKLVNIKAITIAGETIALNQMVGKSAQEKSKATTTTKATVNVTA